MNVERKWRAPGNAAFTWVELMVVLVVLGVIALALLPSIRHRHTPAHRVNCVNHLKNIGLAFRIYATDNEDQFPTVNFTNAPVTGKDQLKIWSYLTYELSTPNLLHCSSDTERSRTDSFQNLSLTNISYFVSLDASELLPHSLLAGDRNIQGPAITNGLMTLTTNTSDISWSMKIHKGRGNVALGDGSVQQLSSSRLRQNVKEGPGTQRLIFPE